MSQQLVRVKIDGAEASVSEDFAAKYNLDVLDKPGADARGSAYPAKYPPEQLVVSDDGGALRGAELNAELEAAGLPTTGKLADKQARLADFRQAQTAGPVADGAGEIGDQS
jgi:hypothetical protein